MHNSSKTNKKKFNRKNASIMKIEIVEYDPNWAKDFEKEKLNLLQLLGSHAVAIEHVGSTAIPNQRAKPVIDIFVGVSPFAEMFFYKHVFNTKEYRYTPTDMAGRHLFAKSTNEVWTHNIHILPYNDWFYFRNEFMFRDYLRKHLELVDEYGEVKTRAATENGSTMEAYTRAKTEFVQMVVDAARKEKGLPVQNVWESQAWLTDD